MRVTSSGDAWAMVRAQLLEDTGEIRSDEAHALIAALLRRAAAARCPCPPRALVDSVADAVVELAPQDMQGHESVDRVFDDLVASGDFLLSGDGDEDELVHLAPPTYVRRRSGSVFLVGGLPDLGLPIPADLSDGLVSRGCYRYLTRESGEEVEALLSAQGFIDYPLDAWREAPVSRAARDLIADLDSRLEASGRAGEVQDLQILDPGRPSTFYRGRWAPSTGRTGRYIARRPRRWGAPLWCYAELVLGEAVRILDLPNIDIRFRGCDEGWWAQCAIDAANGKAQLLKVRVVDGGRVRLSVQTPLPMWAERRVLLVGEQDPDRDTGALLTFELDEQESHEEIAFLASSLWLDIQDT